MAEDEKALRVACESCGKQFRVGAQLAGRRVRCKCGAVIAVPDVAVIDEPPAPDEPAWPDANDDALTTPASLAPPPYVPPKASRRKRESAAPGGGGGGGGGAGRWLKGAWDAITSRDPVPRS